MFDWASLTELDFIVYSYKKLLYPLVDLVFELLRKILERETLVWQELNPFSSSNICSNQGKIQPGKY